MEEYQVTVDGVTHPLPKPFMVLATQNPGEFVGTYPLPEAQMDRFFPARVDGLSHAGGGKWPYWSASPARSSPRPA